MKFQLDDNGRSALHYLLLATLFIGGLRLAIWLFEGDPGAAEVLRPFQQGYWSLPEDAVVSSAESSPLVRTMQALLAACGVLFLSAAILKVILRMPWRLALRRAKWPAAIVVLWGLCTALILPAHLTWPDRVEQAWITVDRSWALGDLWLPIQAERRLAAFADVSLSDSLLMGDASDACTVRVGLVLTDGRAQRVITELHADPPLCATDRPRAQEAITYLRMRTARVDREPSAP